ncbi:MAG: restriction endonuclease [Deltaproteobacteria bacterium]|nr:restriction endonuclease [Deltaproteobacteria bacterium]
MASNNIWLVRAGEGGAFADEFEEQGVVAIGWSKAGPIAAAMSDPEVEACFIKAYPTAKPGNRRSGAGQVKRFVRELKVGDLVATYAPDRRIYLLGTIAGEVGWREHELARVRPVKWTRAVSRDVLSATLRNTLGSILTLFNVEGGAGEMMERSVPLGEEQPVSPPTLDADEEKEDLILGDTERKALGLLEDRLARLDWKQMQIVVAAILRAMGYKTRVAEAGPDRGFDIFASPDGLGFEEPRIFVEVKHRQAQMGSPEIRSFLGGRKPGDRCLYVSTGGFSKDARYEAERSSIPLTLLVLEDLRTLLLEHYENLDAEVRSLVPLKRVYLPVPE